MTQRCTRPTSGSRLRPRVFRPVSKWLDSLYFAVESIHVILNEVKDPSSDSKSPRMLRLRPQDDTPTQDLHMTRMQRRGIRDGVVTGIDGYYGSGVGGSTSPDETRCPDAPHLGALTDKEAYPEPALALRRRHRSLQQHGRHNRGYAPCL